MELTVVGSPASAPVLPRTGKVTARTGERFRTPQSRVAPEKLPAAAVGIRTATPADAERISGIIAPWAAAGVMLPKSPELLREQAGGWQVAVLDGRVVGSVGLRPVNASTVEVVGLAVADGLRGRGVGALLLDGALQRAAADGWRRVFALTLEPGFFGRFGFREGSVHEVPEKIRLDCASCSRRDRCIERMMILDRSC